MVLFVLMTLACSPGYKIDQYQDKEVSINPDYKDITVPHNIAPLNFTVNGSFLSFVKYEVDGDSLIVGEKDNQTDIPLKKWHEFLERVQGKQVNVTVVVNQKGIYVAYKPFLSSVV